jgi:hypothetical protein
MTPFVIRALVGAGLEIFRVAPGVEPLEQIFLKLTQGHEVRS